jgi:hypothetical protein
MGDNISKRRFEQALVDELAKLQREGVNRIDRARVEEIGQRFGIDAGEAGSTFVTYRGEMWQGDLIESDEGPGWEAATLENVPPTATSPDSSI